MIDENIRIEGFSADAWTRLVELVTPETGVLTSFAGPTLLLIEDVEGTILTASIDGIPELSLIGSTAENLEELAAIHNVSKAISLRAGTIESLSERLGLAIRHDLDFVTQLISVASAIRAEVEAGHIRLVPKFLFSTPPPPLAAVRASLDVLIPRGQCVVFVVYENTGEHLATGFVLRRNFAGDLDLLAGPDLIEYWSGALGGDWRRDYRHLLRAVTRHVGEVHAGLFTTESTLEKLMRTSSTGDWAEEAIVRNLIVFPMPAPVAVALGADAVAGFSRRALDSIGSIGSLRRFRVKERLFPVVEEIRNRVIDATQGDAPLDPLRLIAELLRRQSD